MSAELNPAKARIFRIVHAECVPWILEHGLHCRSSATQDPHYINIGSVDLIGKRATKAVPLAPGGTLADYVPFYFTPWSIMMLNIHTGYGGITKRANHEIVILVSSIHRVEELGLPYLFTNQHAYAAGTEYYSRSADLGRIDWPLLQSRSFKTNDADPGRQVRYQAEALIHRYVPLGAILGVGCANAAVQRHLESLVAAHGLRLSVKATPQWYF